MQKSNAEILHHFYSLLLEINFHDSEPPENEELNDPFIQKHLRLIKLRMAKNRALLQKNAYNSIIQYIEKLRKISIEELSKLLNPQQTLQLQPLFSKFESLSKEDKQSIEDDEELLQLITALKDKLGDINSDE